MEAAAALSGEDSGSSEGVRSCDSQSFLRYLCGLGECLLRGQRVSAYGGFPLALQEVMSGWLHAPEREVRGQQ